MAQRVVVLGGGFAGLWSAASAARARQLFGVAHDELDITLVSSGPYHVIRVRCYETDLGPVRVPLDDVLAPIGVGRIDAKVVAIDPHGRSVSIEAPDGAERQLHYDRLVFALGSALLTPAVTGADVALDVDTYGGAARLERHLAALAAAPAPTAATRMAVVIGAGLVGIELACELPQRLRGTLGGAGPVRVLLLDHGDVGAGMGAAAQPVIVEALRSLGVETRSHARVGAIDAGGVTLEGGERIGAATVVLATGMRASPLTQTFDVPCDALGRLPVDAFLQVEGARGVYAAGDAAAARADEAGHPTVMSCQHARPMGRLAGHNAACDLLGRNEDRVAFAAPDYVTILDLGPWGALYTSGWNRETIVAQGADAKTVKRTINGSRIYPPRGGDAPAILAAASPVIQGRPAARN
ncbi:NAD(P)/FAD-dependent oxidoreductase [Chelatococcus reniformis]|uniref:NADH dehydrogenase-like protein n=1 Tax=Chelatococcus reniformis TaxID=1494448 RepID=A0A916UP06_9HYPH|nr:FAD-dependent oxidoreductase [Chelatococcus reniformis]GGC81316.1 NADH dehydrogenase-like protein [Chelatococcus reniformis]